ncbi:MAG TPA: protein kinase [Polyangiaceae bacterium]|nr:protein kinase [Polyangiaceae bacterium]
MRHQRLNTDGKTLQSHRNEEHTTGVGPAASRCLSEDEVMRLCDGEISEEHLPRIDEHLDRCEPCQRWVAEVMAHGETNPADDDTSLHPGAFRAGTMAANRFRIARFIKRGGMGEVYEAFDSVLETRVALKTIISTACDSPRAVRKLKAEVQLARSIRHPNVCSVFDIWEHRSSQDEGSSVYFFTMEFIDGQTLRQLLEHTGFDLDETLRIVRLALFGLRAAHDSGVVHRDFKSDNVMLRNGRHDDTQVVVMDFGLARTLQNEGASNDSEQFAGSVAYMAPEQVEGRRHIGPEADVFAFGVVLFEMLTGELPWVGDSPWTTAALRLTQRAPAPSKLRPGLPPRIDAFVLKCLSREPTERFKDAREALTAFDELLGPAPRQGRRWVGVAAAAVLGLLAALGVQQRTSSSVSALQPEGAAASAAAASAAASSTAAASPPPPSPPAPSEPVRPAKVDDPAPAAEGTPPPAANAAPAEPDAPAAAAPEPSSAAAKPTASARKSKSQRSEGALIANDAPAAKKASALSDSSEPRGLSIPAAMRALEESTNAAASGATRSASDERAPGAPVKLRGFE